MKISTKNLLFNIINCVILGAILIVSSYMVQGNILLKQLKMSTAKVMDTWENELDTAAVYSAYFKKDTSAENQLTKYLDSLSTYNPNISQAYIFGVELKNGDKTKLIAQPTQIREHMKTLGLNLGDYLGQPDRVVLAIKEMKMTGQNVYTDPYTDSVGNWITIIHPLKDTSGNIYAYFGLDIDASMINVGKEMLLTYTLTATIIILLFSIALQILINRRTFSSVDKLVNAIDRVSEGDFSVKLKPSVDELGKVSYSFNVMTSKMKDMIDALSFAITRVSTQSEELFYISEDSKNTSKKLERNVAVVSELVTTKETATEETKMFLTSIIETLNDINAGVNKISAYVEKNSTEDYNIHADIDFLKEHIISAATESESLLNLMTELNEAAEKNGSNARTIVKHTNRQREIFSQVVESATELKNIAKELDDKVSYIIT